MSRERVIYASEALYVGPTPSTGYHFNLDGTGVVSDTLDVATGFDVRLVPLTNAHWNGGLVNEIKQLHRIQSIGYSFNVERTNVNQFGELAAIDRVILNTPTVNLDFSYLLANFANEQNLGFLVDGSETCIKYILNKTEDDKNYFIKTASEGIDAIGDTSNVGETIGIGNGFITSYSSEASVGGFPSVSVSAEGINMRFYDSVSGNFLPSLDINQGTPFSGYRFSLPVGQSNPSGVTDGDLSISTLRPGDIKLTVAKRLTETEEFAQGDYDLAGIDIDNACIQSYSISFDLARSMIQCLGHRFAVSREIDFPVDVSVSIDSLVGDLTTGNLGDMLGCGDHNYDIRIDLYEPFCLGQTQSIICRYDLKDAVLDSQSYSSSIGDNKSVTLNFTSQLGGPTQTSNGLFMSGIAELA